MRESGLDGFRLLASFLVISLHAGNYSALGSEEVGAAIRLSARWAFPFYFMLSGYLLSGKSDIDRASKPLCKSVIIFAMASIGLLPLLALSQGTIGAIRTIFSPALLLSGTYFHLWYLSSAATGLVVIFTCEKMGLNKLIPILSVVSILVYLIIGTYNPSSSRNDQITIARHFSSIGLIYIGMMMRNREPSGKFGLFLCASGLLMQELEAHFLARYFGIGLLEGQFFFGTLLLSIGVFEIARSYGRRMPLSISTAGIDHSLFIYVFHPYALLAFRKIAGSVGLSDVMKDMSVAPAAFLFTFLASKFLLNLMPSIHLAFRGDFRPIERT